MWPPKEGCTGKRIGGERVGEEEQREREWGEEREEEKEWEWGLGKETDKREGAQRGNSVRQITHSRARGALKNL